MQKLNLLSRFLLILFSLAIAVATLFLFCGCKEISTHNAQTFVSQEESKKTPATSSKNNGSSDEISSSESETCESETCESETCESETCKSEPSESETCESETSGSESSGSESSESETSGSESSESESSESEMPDTSEESQDASTENVNFPSEPIKETFNLYIKTYCKEFSYIFENETITTTLTEGVATIYFEFKLYQNENLQNGARFSVSVLGTNAEIDKVVYNSVYFSVLEKGTFSIEFKGLTHDFSKIYTLVVK